MVSFATEYKMLEVAEPLEFCGVVEEVRGLVVRVADLPVPVLSVPDLSVPDLSVPDVTVPDESPLLGVMSDYTLIPFIHCWLLIISWQRSVVVVPYCKDAHSAHWSSLHFSRPRIGHSSSDKTKRGDANPS